MKWNKMGIIYNRNTFFTLRENEVEFIIVY